MMAPGSSGILTRVRPEVQSVASATAATCLPVSPGATSAPTRATEIPADTAGTASGEQDRDPVGALMKMSPRDISKKGLRPRVVLPHASPDKNQGDITFFFTCNKHSLFHGVCPLASQPAPIRAATRAAASYSASPAAVPAADVAETFAAAASASPASILSVCPALERASTSPSVGVVAAGSAHSRSATSSAETSSKTNRQQPYMALYEPLASAQQHKHSSSTSGKQQRAFSVFFSACWWLSLLAISHFCDIPQQLYFLSPSASSLLILGSARPAAAAGTSVNTYLRQHLRAGSVKISSLELAQNAETGSLLLAGAAPAGAGGTRCSSWVTVPVDVNIAAGGHQAGAAPQRRLEALPEAIVKLLDVDKGTGMLIGVLLTLCGSILMAGGSTFMKMGLNLETEGTPRSRLVSFFKVQCCEPLWCAGLAAYSFGALLHIIALAFAPASVLAPMNSVGLIANAVTAATVLKEPFGFRELLFTGGTAVGVTLCAGATLLPHDQFVNMSTSNSPASADITLQSWRDPWYLAYLACCVVAGFATLIILNAEENAVLEEERDRLLLTSSRAAADFEAERILSPKRSLELARVQQQQKQVRSSVDASGRDPTTPLAGDLQTAALLQPTTDQSRLPQDKKIDIHREGEETRRSLLTAEERSVAAEEGSPSQALHGLKKPVSYPRCIGLSYGFLAGLTGAQCVLELKELAACFHKAVDDPNIWIHPQPYLVLIFLAASVWTQIHFLNLGLARGDATLVVPTYYVSWTFFGTLGGFAKFHEIQGFSMGAIVLFSLGFGLTTLCIAILAVQEMNVLRRFVDERVPDLEEEELDLRTQELQEQQLAKQVTLAMGLFPFSMLGRTVGRRRFRPLYQRFRRTRSTASDTALNDAYGELTLSSSAGIGGAYTLPHSLYFHRTEQQQQRSATMGGLQHHYSLAGPSTGTSESISSHIFGRHPSNTSLFCGQSQQQAYQGGPPRYVSYTGTNRASTSHTPEITLHTAPQHSSSKHSSSSLNHYNKTPVLLFPPPKKSQQQHGNEISSSIIVQPTTPGRHGVPRTWTLAQQQQQESMNE